MDLDALQRNGYCFAGTLVREWPTDGPDRSQRDVLANAGWLRDLATSKQLVDLESEVLGADARPVRANLFVKSPGANWPVGWHQDRVVSVKQRAEAPGFSGWSIKAGLPHAIAPNHVLREMIAVRLHLDPCDLNAGALEVLPRSHCKSLDVDQLAARADAGRHLPARMGEVLMLRPLLAHRSGRADAGRQRRVLHVEYAHQQLPEPLEWAYWG